MLIFFLMKKYEELLHCKISSHYFSKKGRVFAYNMSENITSDYLTMSLVLKNFAQHYIIFYFRDSQTPLHLACAWGMELVVQCLMEHGAEVNTQVLCLP